MINKLIKSDKCEGAYFNLKENRWQVFYPSLDDTFYCPEDDCYYVPDFYFEECDLKGYDEEAVSATLNRKLNISNQIEDLKIILTPEEWDLMNKDLDRSRELFDQMSE
jgi:hypothetical protein